MNTALTVRCYAVGVFYELLAYSVPVLSYSVLRTAVGNTVVGDG